MTINRKASELYRDYLNETDPTAKEMLRQAYFRELKSTDEIETWPPEPDSDESRAA